MRKFIIIMVNLLSVCFFSCAHALQVKAAKDNETILFKISAKEYSKIFITGDRIISIKGQDHLYEIKEFNSQHDEGILYIRPSSILQENQKKLFSIFITSEQGHHFTLLLASLDIPAETMEVKPVSASKLIAKKWEGNLPYTQSMIALMRDMVSGSQPEGYAVIPLGKVKPKKIGHDLSMQLSTIYRGGFLEGEVWILRNESKHPVYLHPRQFYQGDVRSVSIMDETLKGGNETILYRIVSHE